jgi:hypothetical protein
MMRTMVLLAMLPLALYHQVWGLPTPKRVTMTVTPPRAYVPSTDTPYRAVETEGVRKVDMDTRTFNARWRSVNEMPMSAPYVPPTEETYMVMPVPVPAQRPELRATPRPRSIRKRSGGDICTRHHMRHARAAYAGVAGISVPAITCAKS